MFHVADIVGAFVGPTDAAIADQVALPSRGLRGRSLVTPRTLGTLTLTVLCCVCGAASGVAAVAGDSRDAPIVGFAVNQALERERSGGAIPWTNAQTGHSGTIILEAATYAEPNKPCRGYRRTIEQPGFSPAEVRGNGCRIGPALWTVEETVVTVAVAVGSPPSSPTPSASPAPPPARKASPTSVTTRKPAADPLPISRAPSLPAYTLPSRAGS